MSETVRIENLHHYYRNPRNGDVESIAESLKEFGQYRTIVANRGTHTGRPNEVLAGNHVLLAARALGWLTIEVDWVDYGEDDAAKIVLIDNRSGDLSTYDGDALAALIASVGNLGGTGYTKVEEARTAKAGIGEAPKQTKPSGGQGHDQYEDFDRYKASDTRHLFLEWPVAEYEQVMEDLEALRKRWALPTAGDVVKALLR